MRIAIIGGGAAGFMAAITAAQTNPQAQITIYEKQPKVLSKVRISGGGRCNVTYNEPDVPTFAKQYPRGQHFLRKLMMRFGQPETIAWFERHGVRLKAESDGRMFPITDDAETVIQCLCGVASDLGIRIMTKKGVSAFGKCAPHTSAAPFTLTFEDGTTTQTDRLLIATGGKPKATDYAWLATEHRIISPVPSLFTFNAPGHFLLPLMGVSVPVAHVRILETKHNYQGPVLITHWGLSGPAVLKLSALAARELSALQYRFTVRVNWVPAHHEQSIKEHLQQVRHTDPRKQVHNTNLFALPNRLWVALCTKSGIVPEIKWAELSKSSLQELALMLTQCTFAMQGKTTYKEEFVTAGGIALTEVHSATLESKRLPGLYFAGEVLDIDGITGGFNFQNAWTTGYIAGKSIAEKPVEN